MFQSNSEDFLFSKYDWHSIAESHKQNLRQEIAAMDGNRLLNTSVDDLCNYFVKKFSIDVPRINRDGITVDQREASVDVSRDPHRHIRDRSRPFHISGTQIDVIVPFEGETDFFYIRPSTFSLSPPRGSVQNGDLCLIFTGIDLQADEVKSQINRTLNQIEENLSRLRTGATELLKEIPGLTKQVIESRRSKLLGDQHLVASLGFKMRERENSKKTFAAPEVRRQVRPKLPDASSTPYKPEPVLVEDDYTHILSVIQNMAQVMERSPTAFVAMDEESLRTHFLVQLNGHYQGQATGETFNYEGKTDILIRSEGKNIFIGECKFWGGAKKMAGTIDQLLGYSAWRDTKVAILVFNRNKDFSNVLNSIDECMQAHSNFKSLLGKQSSTSFQYKFSHRDDENRELIITVLAFDIPN